MSALRHRNRMRTRHVRSHRRVRAIIWAERRFLRSPELITTVSSIDGIPLPHPVVLEPGRWYRVEYIVYRGGPVEYKVYASTATRKH